MTDCINCNAEVPMAGEWLTENVGPFCEACLDEALSLLRERDATITRLEQEKAGLAVIVRTDTEKLHVSACRAESAEAALVALRPYVQHKPNCFTFRGTNPKCTCGLSAIFPDERPTPTEER